MNIDDLITLRRDLHRFPELGFEEIRTSKIVAQILKNAGLKVHVGLGKTGVVGSLKCGDGNKEIALRADMDALAMPEHGDVPWRSQNEGRMHACGHDGHSVMLLGAACQMAKRNGFNGTVHFVFQPAEEGRGGAKAMIEDGFFDLFKPSAVYGLHNMPGLETNEMAIVSGPQLACSDSWKLSFIGEGTHGAKPHLGRDPITAGAQFLAGLHSIVARVTDPLQPAVISACALKAGDFNALNVIPDEFHIGGTARAFSFEVRDILENEIGRLADGIAKGYNVKADYTYIRRIPPVVNAQEPTQTAKLAAQSVIGDQRIMHSFPPSTAGDDFAEFSTRIPGCYVWLGNGPARDGALHHNTRYDFNDEAIKTGVEYWCSLIEQALPQ